MRNTYRTKKQIKDQFGIRSTTTVDKYIAFLKKHEDRYDPEVVLKGRRIVLIDEDAFKDAWKYWTMIELGVAPEYKKRVAV